VAALARADGPPAADAGISVYHDGAWVDAHLYRRDALFADHHIDGPAVIAQADCTTCVLGGWSVDVDLHGNLIITPNDKDRR
jgi:N-methylhydantoinase A